MYQYIYIYIVCYKWRLLNIEDRAYVDLSWDNLHTESTEVGDCQFIVYAITKLNCWTKSFLNSFYDALDYICLWNVLQSNISPFISGVFFFDYYF